MDSCFQYGKQLFLLMYTFIGSNLYTLYFQLCHHFLSNTFKKLSLQKNWFPVYWNEKGIG